MMVLSEEDAKQVGLDKVLYPCYSSFAGIKILLDYFNVIMRPIDAITPHLIELKFHGTCTHFFPCLSVYLIHHDFSLKETGLEGLFFFNCIILIKLQLHEECMIAMIEQQSIFVLFADLDPLIADFSVDGPRTQSFQTGPGCNQQFVLAVGFVVFADEISWSRVVESEGTLQGRMVLVADQALVLNSLHQHLQLFSLFLSKKMVMTEYAFSLGHKEDGVGDTNCPVSPFLAVQHLHQTKCTWSRHKIIRFIFMLFDSPPSAVYLRDVAHTESDISHVQLLGEVIGAVATCAIIRTLSLFVEDVSCIIPSLFDVFHEVLQEK